jgi:uncharacterized damage-inducible protein DinB
VVHNLSETTPMMVHSVSKNFTRLEKQMEELLKMVEPLSHIQQNFKPAAGEWSILQVFRHLIQSEGQINNYLQKKILGVNSIRKAGIFAKIRSMVLNTAMRLPVKYKVPEPIKVKFDDFYEFEKLTKEWKLLRQELKNFLEGLDEQTARKEIFRHPVVGRMSIIQGLAFMQEHLARHTQQVRRCTNHNKFPKDENLPV